MSSQATLVYRADYRPYPWKIASVRLEFQLALDDEGTCKCVSHMQIEPADGAASTVEPLYLDRGLHASEESTSVAVSVDGLPSLAHTLAPSFLAIPLSAGPHTVSITTTLWPGRNTALEGLYRSGGNYCTQCEAQGFRHITPYPDRPDVLTVFSVRIEAPVAGYPVLLSNGNLVAQGALSGGRHFAEWRDPFRKPAYLFALVAGNLRAVSDSFTTASGQRVKLNVFVQEANKDKCQHALNSLKKAMRWDEVRYGLEYDLDLYNIVAIDDFNMGAMENKGLNIFNSRLVCASPQTATDADYHRIESVVGHEYFHNWTGNRVTCRDWFQLTLKEGLTVFRDQEFSADMHSPAVQRIEDVQELVNRQFVQDKGEMRHPIRPEQYLKMDNFYTATVYEKGAEVVRLYQTLLGEAGFRKGLERYIQRHDGEAVTCEDFLAAMDLPGANLAGLAGWYSQVGTPQVNVRREWDQKAGVLHLHCTQSLPPAVAAEGTQPPQQAPLLIPLALGLLHPTTGSALALQPAGPMGDQPVFSADATNAVLRFAASSQTFSFKVDVPAVPSLFRNFSAPVALSADLTQNELLLQLTHDADPFNKWAAKKVLLQQASEALWERGEGQAMQASPVLRALRQSLGCLLDSVALREKGRLDMHMMALLLSIPPCESQFVLRTGPTAPDTLAVLEARRFVETFIAEELEPSMMYILADYGHQPCRDADDAAVAQRSLAGVGLRYLTSLGKEEHRVCALRVYTAGTDHGDMTQQVQALAALNFEPSEEREEAFRAFERQWSRDPLVMLKWLSLQAGSALPGNTEFVRTLTHHPAFSWLVPNSVYSLFGAYTQDFRNFHARDGSGYAFLRQAVQTVNDSNGQVAARIAAPFVGVKNLDPARQDLMRREIEQLQRYPSLTDNVAELLANALKTFQ